MRSTTAPLSVCSPTALVLAAALAASPLTAQIVFAPPEHAVPPLPGDATPSFIASGDFNEDGPSDLLVMQGILSGVTTLLVGAGDGTFTANRLPNPGIAQPMAARDIDGDGHLDLVGPNFFDSVWVPGNGDGTFSSPIVLPVGGPMNEMAAADLDGNGRLDLVTNRAVAFAGNVVEVVLQNDDGSFTLVQSMQVGTQLFPILQSLDLADVDGGGLDLVIGRSDGGVLFFEGLGGGLFATSPMEVEMFPNSTSPIPLDNLLVADVDGNGTVDLLATGDAPGPELRLGNGDGTFGEVLALPDLPNAPGAMVLADWDGDGHLDLGVSSGSFGLGMPGELIVLRNLGAGVFEHELALTIDGPFLNPEASDHDGDGLPDLAAFLATSDLETATIVLIPNATYGTNEPFTDLGAATAGVAGWPVLLCEGSLRTEAPFAFTLANAPEGALPVLVFGNSVLGTPALGGTLWPSPDRLITLAPVGTDGQSTLAGRWPSQLMGVDLWLQVWFADPEGPEGFAATTGVAVEAP